MSAEALAQTSEPDRSGGLIGKLAAPKAGVDAGVEARRRMNLIKRYAPLLTALVANPGMEASSLEKGGAFRRMIVQSDRVSQELVRRLTRDLAVHDLQWLVMQASTTCSELVANRWYRESETDISVVIDEVARTIPPGDQLDDIANMAQPDEAATAEMGPLDSRRATFRMSLLKHCAPIAEELLTSSLSAAERKAALIELQDAMLDELTGNQALRGEYQKLRIEDRVMLLQNHLAASARIMKMSLQVECDRGNGRPEVARVVSAWREALDALVGAVEVEVRAASRLERAINVGSPVLG